ncbi:MAG: tetratricopeptide repeat protein [Saprospiraceae bacterium]|nr:tetratricopeptide repeat protein [Saprospiraceae bacterium]
MTRLVPTSVCSLLLACLISTGLAGQDLRLLTNEDLNLQKLFIEANREKLLGAYEDAASLYQEVLAQDPDNDAAAYELSRVYESMGKLQEALDYIESAIKIDGQNTWYRMMKGDILERMEEYGGAIEVYRHLTELNPKEHYYFQHLVELYLNTNQPETALATLDEFERHAGVLPDIIRTKVDILDSLQRPADAVNEIEKLVQVYTGNLEYLHLMASYCIQAGFDDRARTYYQRILEIDPNDARANIAGADDLKKQGADAQYLRSIRSLIQNQSIDLNAKIQELIPYVERFAESRDAELGVALGDLITDLVAQHGDEAKTHALYADYLYYSGKPVEAVREYEKTLVLDKSVFDVWEQLLYIQTELNDPDGVIHTAEQAKDVFPNQATIYYLCGMAYARKRDFHASQGELQQALIMSGRNAELRFNVLSLLGSVYYELGDKSRSFEAYDKALGINPNHVSTLTSYAYLLAVHKQDLSRAQEMAQKALKAAPGNAGIEHTLAWIAFQQSDFTNARKYIELSMDHGGGDNYVVLEHYGDILYALGDVDGAVELWQLSVDRGNPSEVVKRKISERKMIHRP